jgi:hypothetical protein
MFLGKKIDAILNKLKSGLNAKAGINFGKRR